MQSSAHMSTSSGLLRPAGLHLRLLDPEDGSQNATLVVVVVLLLVLGISSL